MGGKKRFLSRPKWKMRKSASPDLCIN
jgi:hypothetical protein